MIDRSAAIVFFFGLFWATMLNSVNRHQLFDTAACFRTGRVARAWKRLFIGILFVDVLPIVLLLGVYHCECIIPNNATGWRLVASSAVAALSLFGIPRIVHAIVATRKTWEHFYDQDEHRKYFADSTANLDDTFGVHFWPGVTFLILPMFIAALINRFA